MSFVQPYPPLLELSPIGSTPFASYSSHGATRRASLNQQCLETLTTWLQEELGWNARAYPRAVTLPNLWEFINGTALTVADLRLVLVPAETVTRDELRVPQEWVDIPAWVADYYLALHIDPEENWVQISGYTSHQQLKTEGMYDPNDRTYSLDPDNLLQDINSLWITHLLAPLPIARAEVAPLPTLAQVQATTLLERLGRSELVFPRLEVPFQQWGALLSHGGWRQQLYERRQGLSSGSVPQWLQSGLSGLAQQLGWQRRDFVPVTAGVRSLSVAIERSLTIANHPYELRVFMVEHTTPPVWRFELRSATPGGFMPPGCRLRLLTEDLQAMEHNEDMATSETESLYVDVVLEPGEGVVWEIEPVPEEYDREILRF